MVLCEDEKRDIENEKSNLKCQVGTMGFSNASLEYLNYPTQVESKLLQHVCHDKKNLEGRKIVLSTGDLQMLQADSCASRWNTHPGDQSLLTMVVIDVEKKVTGIVIYVFGRLCFWSLQYKRNQCPRGSVMVLWTFWPRASCALGSSSSCWLTLR